MLTTTLAAYRSRPRYRLQHIIAPTYFNLFLIFFSCYKRYAFPRRGNNASCDWDRYGGNTHTVNNKCEHRRSVNDVAILTPQLCAQRVRPVCQLVVSLLAQLFFFAQLLASKTKEISDSFSDGPQDCLLLLHVHLQLAIFTLTDWEGRMIR